MEQFLNIFKNHPLMLMLGLIVVFVVICIFVIAIIIIVEHYHMKNNESIQKHQIEMLKSSFITQNVHDSLKGQIEEKIIEDNKNKLDDVFKIKSPSINLFKFICECIKGRH